MSSERCNRLSSLSLLLVGTLFGVSFMINCGGGGAGGLPVDAGGGVFAGKLHVDPDTSGPHALEYDPALGPFGEINELRSILFTPQGPNDVVLAVMVEGRYSASQSDAILHVHVYMDDGGAPLTSHELVLDSGDDAPFLISLPIHGGVVRGGGSLPAASIGIRVFATLPNGGGAPTVIERIDIKLLCLEDVSAASPTTQTAPNPLDADVDGDGFTPRRKDCDDNDPLTHPLSPELPDEKDNDCDGQIDEGIQYLWYWQDADGDGFGRRLDPISSPAQPEGYVMNNFDCDDADPTVNPDAMEVADGKDNDCDGQIDETVDTQIYYMDLDQDGYGGSSDFPPGYNGFPVENGLDCNDDDVTVYPGAPEVADGKDNDCDGQVDE